MKFHRILSAIVLLFLLRAAAIAQAPDAMIGFGGLQVRACAVSTDLEYGLSKTKPIQLRGGPLCADSRMALCAITCEAINRGAF